MAGKLKKIPWWAKIGAKLVLSRLPFSYTLWSKLRLFRHGAMDRPSYALQVMRLHMELANLSNLDGMTVLELGPGDSLVTALVARALGAREVILVDGGRFCDDRSLDLRPYTQMAELLAVSGFSCPDIQDCRCVAEVLEACNGRYLTNGRQSLTTLPSGGIDFLFSQAVLEHIRLEEFHSTVAEFSRLLAPGGITTHRVDLKDHLGGALHHLRFSRRLWESRFWSSAGFYTNRLRRTEILSVFVDVGLDIRLARELLWDEVPIAPSHLHSEFRSLGMDELRVQEFDLVGIKAGRGAAGAS